jgi:hypothetical protein
MSFTSGKEDDIVVAVLILLILMVENLHIDYNQYAQP